MKKHRVFVSHSWENKPFAQIVARTLQCPEMEPWIDKNEIVVGEDLFDAIGRGLKSMDIFIILISQPALKSGWVDRELKFAARREIVERLPLILPFLIDATSIDDLPWMIVHRYAPRVVQDETGAEEIMQHLLRAIERRTNAQNPVAQPSENSAIDPRVDAIIKGIWPPDWSKAYDAALIVLGATGASGENELFWSLIRYIDSQGDWDLKFVALQVIESFAQLAPAFFDRALLQRMANYSDFSVRSAAAAICQTFANCSPDRMPLDVLIKLADCGEDWYVMAPALAALKTLCSSRPTVLRVFSTWLRSDDPRKREHGASALFDVCRDEPGIVDAGEISEEVEHLNRIGDTKASTIIAKAIPLAPQTRNVSLQFKYTI